MAVDRRTKSPRRTPARQRTNRTLGRALVRWATTTDHKVIGHLYLATSFGFFLLGGVLAMLMRSELARPGLQLFSNEQYNQLFTVHGTIMMLLFATPLFAGFTNVIMPLQIGAPDLAFPRLNALSYWMYLFGGLMVVSGFLTPGGAASFGWFAYAPLNSATFSPGPGGDLWTMGLVVSGVSTTLSAVNFISTIICLRAPGMTMFRMPIFTWNILFTSILVLPAFPVLTAALLMLEADRKFGAHVFDAANGGALLWQHLFWFFGHPEVYIVALPFFGIVTEIIPVFSRKPIFGYVSLVGATIAITFLSAVVWAHHMFATGADGADGVQGGEAVRRQVVGVAARHALLAEPVLDEEGGLEADEESPEVDLAEAFVEQFAGELRPPEVEAGEHREDDRAEQHVVQVGDDEVRVRQVEVQGRGGDEDAAHAAEQEGHQEAAGPQHGCLEGE